VQENISAEPSPATIKARKIPQPIAPKKPSIIEYKKPIRFDSSLYRPLKKRKMPSTK
jgi:hypothetical protein